MAHVMCLRDLGAEKVTEIIRRGIAFKRDPQLLSGRLAGKGMLMLFEKTSTRTALSFQAAVGRLGGYSVVLDWARSNFAISPIATEARYASSNCDLIVARLRRHGDLRTLAENSSVPVINGCDDRFHPSQALADFMTILEVTGSFEGVTVCYVGILNNIANSLIEGALLLGVRLRLVTPIVNSASFDQGLMDEAKTSGLVTFCDDLHAGLSGADFVYTDTWIDMENFDNPDYAAERETRVQTMGPSSITLDKLGDNPPFVMHDMPIHPGFEIAIDVVNHPKSIIFQQAENRMHVEEALLTALLNEQ